MTIQLDHLIVPSRDRVAAARQLASVLGVPWAAQGVGPFSPVFVSEQLTLDFDQHDEPFPVLHYCFKVSPEQFDAIRARLDAAGIVFRSLPHGPADRQINTLNGGHMLYWSEPDGHVWEILTVSYARQPV